MTDAVDVHVRRGMPYSFVVAAVLLLCAGAVAIFYFGTFWGVLIPLTLVFFQRAGWRILYKLLWLLIVIPFMPEKWRHAYFELAGKIPFVGVWMQEVAMPYLMANSGGPRNRS
jgi:hypothetical protein